MPRFSTDPQNLDDPAANEQRAAFIAVLAGVKMGREWGGHTTGILGFATFLRDHSDDCDAETRREMWEVVTTHSQQLRRLNHAVRFAAQILSGISIPSQPTLLDLPELMGRIIALEFYFGKAPQVLWSEPEIRVKGDEKQWFVMLSALLHHGLLLTNTTKTHPQNPLQITIERDGDAILFAFRGNTNPKNFTDPDTWFTINRKVGSVSIGLFATRELAALNGGRVWVETADKTRFDYRLRLPIKQKEDAPNE